MAQAFDDLMARALALTRSGQLGEATRAIQRALGAPAWPPAAHRPADSAAGGVPDRLADGAIDVEARELPPSPALGAPGAPAPGPSASTSARPPPAPAEAPARFTAGLFKHRLGQRHYRLFVPAGHSGGGLPLVVMLHGCQQTAEDFALGTGMNRAAQAQGVCVLYPEQAAEHNPQRCWNWFKHSHQQRGRGEPALLAALVQAVVAELRSDASRVHVAGLSAGGAMAAILAQTHPDLFAAVGVHSGLAAGAAHDLPSALAAMQGRAGAGAAATFAAHAAVATVATVAAAPAVPMIIFHGDQDPVVAPANAAALLAAHLAKPDSVCSQQALRPAGAGRRGATRTLVHHPQGGLVAEQWLVHGAGHAWSGGQVEGSFTDPQGPDASAEMLRFFAAHRLTHPA